MQYVVVLLLAWLGLSLLTTVLFAAVCRGGNNERPRRRAPG